MKQLLWMMGLSGWVVVCAAQQVDDAADTSARIKADRGRVEVNGQAAKPARELRPGDSLQLRLDVGVQRTVVIRALSAQRGPAPVAQALYEETAASLAARERAVEARRLAPEPAQSIDQGRPSKRNRRALEKTQVEWQRWSASADDR